MRKNIDEIKTVLQRYDYSINNIIIDIMKKFNFKSLCCNVGMKKDSGFSASEIIRIILLLPFMLISSVNAFYGSQYINITKAHKDTIYRLKNNEKLPWRALLYAVAKKFKMLVNTNTEIAENSAFIIDDTIDTRVGDNIEKISFVHDHVGNKKGSTLGFKNLLLGYFDGTSIIPLDFSIHSEKELSKKKQKEQFKKDCIKNSNGFKRRKECSISKITNALSMLKRSIKHGFMAKYVLVDSWFSSKGFIQDIREIKNGALHVVCAVKKDKRNYEYNGKSLNAKQLITQLRAESKEKRCRKWNTRYFEVEVNYDEIGTVKLYICRFPYQKDWRVFLSTNTELKFVDMMEIYSARWTVEVMFRELKQHLQLGKCQSRDFDAQIASITISLIQYIFLSYCRREDDYTSIGGLFKLIKDEVCQKNLAQRLWELFEELLQVVIKNVSESGIVDLLMFKKSPEYIELKLLFESSFLSNQIFDLDKAV